MNNLILDSKKDESGVNVTRYKRTFGENEVEFAKVSRKTADVDSLLTLISRYDTGVNRLMIQYCIGLFKRAVLEKLETGRAVNILGLGTMYINATFKADGSPDLSVGFTPSAEAAEAVKNLETSVSDSVTLMPEIEEVYDLKTKSSDGKVSLGKDIRLYGKRMKLVDSETETAFVAFAPCGQNGIITETDKSLWKKVFASELSTNKPSELQFYLPDSLAAGTYKIVLSTCYSINGKNAKAAARTCEFDAVIKAEDSSSSSSD